MHRGRHLRDSSRLNKISSCRDLAPSASRLVSFSLMSHLVLFSISFAELEFRVLQDLVSREPLSGRNSKRCFIRAQGVFRYQSSHSVSGNTAYPTFLYHAPTELDAPAIATSLLPSLSHWTIKATSNTTCLIPQLSLAQLRRIWHPSWQQMLNRPRPPVYPKPSCFFLSTFLLDSILENITATQSCHSLVAPATEFGEHTC